MRIGLYIGNFNPPHYGHQYTILYALQAANVEEICLAPVYQRHDGGKMEPWSHRCNLTNIALFPFREKVYWLSSDRVAREMDGGSGLMSETVEAFRKGRKEPITVVLIMNAKKRDKMKTFPDLKVLEDQIAQGSLEIFWVENQNDISSKFVRVALCHGWGTKKFVPHLVKEYITRHNLYKCKDCG